MGFVLVVGASIVLALMRGGRLPADRTGWGLLVIGMLMEVVSDRAETFMVLCLATQVLAYVAVFAFWRTHRPSPGLAVFTAGDLLNLLVIGLNGWRLPADAALAATMNFAPPGLLHTAVTPATRAAFLGDVIPLQTLHQLVSPGELLMMVGIFLACQEWCGRPIRFPKARTASGGASPQGNPARV